MGRTTKLVIATTLGLAVTVLVAAVAYRASTWQPPSVSQPLAFSHRIHSGDNAIPCLYCHSSARRGPAAGVPALERCVGCHLAVAKDRPDVVNLMQYWDKKQPIAWVRIHDLPEYVRFNHKRHVVAGVQCQVCHGEVQRMEVVAPVADLTMGWCLNCHKERGASTDCLTCHY